MGLDKIGTYKGYDVFKIGQRNIKENECLNDVMYVVAETGETILNGEVVAHVDLKEMRVDELPRSERIRYFKKKESRKVESKVVDCVETATVDNLFAGMDVIDKYIKSALAQDLISEFKIPTLEV